MIAAADREWLLSKSLNEKVECLQMADFLNIESLIQLFCAGIAQFFRSVEHKDLAREFNVDFEMTSEEE